VIAPLEFDLHLLSLMMTPPLSTFSNLESNWLEAVRKRDISTLDGLLDESFVCTPWSSNGELLLRSEYLNEVKRTQFQSCGVEVLNVQMLESFAIVNCRVDCEYALGNSGWKAHFLVTDVWVRKGEDWKILNRHASIPNAGHLPELRSSGS
jgi:SnoaL-like domain